MLKQLIQRLLDSRTTPAEAAHSAMPKPENPTIISKGMYRLLMALLSMQVPENPSSFVYKHKDFSLCMLADTTLWLFEFTKEKRYFYKRKILKNFVDSYRLERTNNVKLGGALC